MKKCIKQEQIVYLIKKTTKDCNCLLTEIQIVFRSDTGFGYAVRLNAMDL